MRSFRNRKGEKITVTEEHLQIAVALKLELQKNSPSGKVSWKQHKKMMEKENFFDSDTNENYRCMIKDYQKSIGELPEAPKYADMVSNKKLDSIKEAVGELAFEKRYAQTEFRKLNKVRRDIIDFSIIAEEIGNAFKNHDFSDLQFNPQPIIKSNKKMIVCLADLHIGALVDNEYNTYNYKKAVERLEDYLSKLSKEIKVNDISEVYLINLGDSIENPYMHNLSYNCEFTLSEQITVASDLIIKFMVKLAEMVKVTVAGIGGNHDRLNADKNKSLTGDHAVKGINKAIQSFLEGANKKISERITYEQADNYEHSACINGVNVKFIHGDLDNQNDRNLIGKHSSLDGIDYSLVIMGHYHSYRVMELGFNKFIVVIGSPKGADDYAKDKLRLMSSPSQGIVIIDENGEIDMKRIGLVI